MAIDIVTSQVKQLYLQLDEFLSSNFNGKGGGVGVVLL